MKQIVRPVPLNRYLAAALRARARLRYHLYAATRPSLRRGGPWIWLGPGCTVTLRRGARLVRDDGMALRRDCHVDVNGELTVGRNVFFNAGAHVTALSRIRIGDDTRFGERVSIHDGNHRFEPVPVVGEPRREYLAEPVTIGSRVWIGANSVVLPGSSIGDDCVVAAGSVVRGTFPQASLIAGAPAEVVRPLSTGNGDGSHEGGPVS